MRTTYMFRYCWSAVWNKQDRMFSLLNIFSVAATMLILVSLTGLLRSFKDYSESILNKLPLSVEIFKSKDTVVADLTKIEGQIRQFPEVRFPLFDLEEKYSASLKDGTVAKEIQEEFIKHKRNILPSSIVKIELEDKQWTILHQENEYQYLIEKEKGYLHVYGISLFKRVPALITLLSEKDERNTVSNRNRISGCTTLPQEPFALQDIYGNKISFLNKSQLKSPFDEVGLIVSFDLLKKLGYLPDKAVPDKESTWQGNKLPKNLKIYVVDTQQPENPPSVELPVPIIGVVADLPRGNYIITEDFYNILLQWRHPFRYMLKDRNDTPLLYPQAEIKKAYYVLKSNEAEWVDMNSEIFRQYSNTYKVQIFFQTWESSEQFQERLTISPISMDQKLSEELLQRIDQRLRSHSELQNLDKINKEEEKDNVRTWEEFMISPSSHQYIEGSLYIKDRAFIRPLLEKLRGIGLYASSPLERYLKNFESQEKFFVGVTLAIFALVLFLSSTVLFSTFYTSILRKRKEIGIFKAYGASRALVLFLFYLQSFIIIAVGSLLGIFGGFQLGKILSNWINRFALLTESRLIFTLPDSYIAVLCAIVIACCWLAIFFPARIATSVDPSQVVRH